MKIMFFGDSVTDASRARADSDELSKYGMGYVRSIAGKLKFENPEKYNIINKGISGNRVVDLYARIKCDVWNYSPDILSILIGINDIWHEINKQNGVDLERFEKVYDMLIFDTLKNLPNTQIILIEPFVLKGEATEAEFERFNTVRDYAKIVKKLAEKYNLLYLPLQDKFDEITKKHDVSLYLIDGVHPNIAGSELIAEEWIKFFKEKIDK